MGDTAEVEEILKKAEFLVIGGQELNDIKNTVFFFKNNTIKTYFEYADKENYSIISKIPN